MSRSAREELHVLELMALDVIQAVQASQVKHAALIREHWGDGDATLSALAFAIALRCVSDGRSDADVLAKMKDTLSGARQYWRLKGRQ